MTGHPPSGYSWLHDISSVDLAEVSNLYRIAPLGDKPPDALATVFGNSMFRCFAAAQGHKRIILYANPGTEGRPVPVINLGTPDNQGSRHYGSNVVGSARIVRWFTRLARGR